MDEERLARRSMGSVPHDFMRGCPDDCFQEHVDLTCPLANGIQLCRSCGQAEAELTTECPGPDWRRSFEDDAARSGVAVLFADVTRRPSPYARQPHSGAFPMPDWWIEWRDPARPGSPTFDYVKGAWRFWTFDGAPKPLAWATA